VTRTSVE